MVAMPGGPFDGRSVPLRQRIGSYRFGILGRSEIAATAPPIQRDITIAFLPIPWNQGGNAAGRRPRPAPRRRLITQPSGCKRQLPPARVLRPWPMRLNPARFGTSRGSFPASREHAHGPTRSFQFSDPGTSEPTRKVP